MKISWNEFKSFVDLRNMDVLMIENSTSYLLYASEASFAIECTLFKTPSDATDLVDFETNYKDYCNPYRQVYDSSGKPFARFAIAKEGNTLQCLAFSFKTSDKDSFRCKESDNTTDKDGISYKMYDDEGDETLTNADCVHTRIIFEPTYNYEIVGGQIFQKVTPSESILAYLTAIPDITAENGGSRQMSSGGFDLSFLGSYSTYGIDGRAPKELRYDATYHTNKLHLDFYHSAGFQHEIMFKYEMYK